MQLARYAHTLLALGTLAAAAPTSPALAGPTGTGSSGAGLAAAGPAKPGDRDTLAEFRVPAAAWLAKHPEAGRQFIATGAMMFDDEGRVLLVQRAATDTMPNQWEVPGGGVDDEDASILDGVLREVREEAGIEDAKVDRQVGDMVSFASGSGRKIGRFYFTVAVTSAARGSVRLDPKEHQDYVWVTRAEVEQGRTAGSTRTGKKGKTGVVFDFKQQDIKTRILQAFDVHDESRTTAEPSDAQKAGKRKQETPEEEPAAAKKQKTGSAAGSSPASPQAGSANA